MTQWLLELAATFSYINSLIVFEKMYCNNTEVNYVKVTVKRMKSFPGYVYFKLCCNSIVRRHLLEACSGRSSGLIGYLRHCW